MNNISITWMLNAYIEHTNYFDLWKQEGCYDNLETLHRLQYFSQDNNYYVIDFSNIINFKYLN